MTRPKSSKGRSRPPADRTVRVAADVHSDQPQPPAVGRRADGYTRSRSHSVTRLTATKPPGQDGTAPPQCVPARSALSLNKYKVLPSIKKQLSHTNDLEIRTSKIKLCEHGTAQHRRHSHGEAGCSTARTAANTQTATRSYPEMGNGAEVYCGQVGPDPKKPPDPNPNIMETQHETDPVVATDELLLLAIRAPCGRRFQQHFAHADTLQTLIACAETRYETSYVEAFVETMDVPRRSFRRLDMTLAECCVFNRSVLCISQESNSGQIQSVVEKG
ncbi:hypothetical protein NHX12_012865 [Muraenolepis orangiensis]|uniref:UBX domain-containing protein n=1 Tax=Muraenolepis orangiensis TaxID=630683 RepID=A0A9Q0I4F1_9TELE|nr:hypothetical protein NHX12_012865 [Muraenolepis orangiensis]